MSKIVAIIQARMGSTRLPGKVLMDIEGKPMLVRVIERVKESKLVNTTIVAMPRKDYYELAPLAVRYGNGYSLGSENDVLGRYYKSVYPNWDIIVRITSDCPLIDPKVVDKAIQYYLNNEYEYIDTIGTYPDGLDTEVFSYNILKETYLRATDAYDREHVTPYMIKNFNVGKLESGQDFSKYHWSVDTAEDLEFVRWVYRKLGDKFYLEDILNLLKEEK